MTLVIPKSLEDLAMVKKVSYKGIQLKTDYLLHLTYHFLFQYAFDQDEIRLNATILQNNYGKHYLRYVEYLIDNGLIKKIGNYSSDHGFSNTYKLNIIPSDVVAYRPTDYVFTKKFDYRLDNTINNRESPIPVEIRKKLIIDLDFISIDAEKALQCINTEITDNPRKKLKNLIMVEKIKTGDIFCNFDDYGRFHSNFTNLKKKIRNQYLSIEGEPVESLDIPTSQPFFLCQILKQDFLVSDHKEVKRFIDLVENEDLYQYFQLKYPSKFSDRDKVKPMMFKCLFDDHKYLNKNKEIFKQEFPFILDYIDTYRSDSGEDLWMSLQRMESYFIFHEVYPAIIHLFKDIHLFTVHDSIHFPGKYYSIIKNVWDQKLAARKAIST